MRYLAPLPRRPGLGMWPTRVAGGAAAWTPADETGVLTWLRGDTYTATSGRVSSWTDKSGSGHPATSTGATGTRPLATTWAAGNGQPALYFDGARTLATAANILPTGDGAGFTTFLVCAFADLNFRCALLTNALGGGIALAQNAGAITEWKLGVAFSDDGPAVVTPLNLISVDQVGATPGSVMYVNGATVATTSPDGNIITPSGKLYLGASATTNFFQGYIAEVLILSGRASLGTIANWNAYSLARYGV